MTVAGQPPVSYSWDSANRLQTITRDTLVAAYLYDDANRRTQLTLPNGVVIGYSYDEANRLLSLTYSRLQVGPQSLTYAYDPSGNRVRTGGSWARTLLPAAITSASYDAANRQLTLGAKSMTYDLNGNLATLTESGQTTTYTWDARDRLVGLSGPGLSASFGYDAEDRRTQKTITGFSTTFQYDDADIIKEIAGGATVNYLRSLEIDETIARVEEGGTLCYAPDALASTVALTDGAGGVSTEYTYEPFGRVISTGTPSQNPFQFTGRENDSNGLYFYRARYYSPALARFITQDPLEFAGGDSNFYAYVGNNPINWVDPLGQLMSPRDAKDKRDEVCALLRTAVVVACKETSTRCEESDPCEVLRFKIAVKSLCIVAQQTLTKTCYPHDPTHKDRIEELKGGIRRCERFLRAKNCDFCPRPR